MLFQNTKIQDLNVIHNRSTHSSTLDTLFQNTKIQDLNVIHNLYQSILSPIYVVSEYKDTRFECNSQQENEISYDKMVVSEYKDTRFECNSQLLELEEYSRQSCFRIQRYKI